MRLPPLPADEWDDAARQALSGMLPAERQNPRDAGNALATLVRHPELAKSFLRFNVYLLTRSTLPPRLRELAILRVAHRCDCTYEWLHHVELGMRAGLSEDDVAGVQSAGATDETHRAVIDGVDELLATFRLSDKTWADLSDRLDERQRMDLVFTVGCYTALAMAFNTFGVEVEEDFGRAMQRELQKER